MNLLVLSNNQGDNKMAQKKKLGFDGIFETTPTNKRKNKKNKVIRTTFYVTQDRLEMVRAFAWYKREPVKDIINKAIDGFFSNFKKESKTSLKSYRHHKKVTDISLS